MEDSGALTTYTYDAANQLQDLEDSSGVTTFTYDATVIAASAPMKKTIREITVLSVSHVRWFMASPFGIRR